MILWYDHKGIQEAVDRAYHNGSSTLDIATIFGGTIQVGIDTPIEVISELIRQATSENVRKDLERMLR